MLFLVSIDSSVLSTASRRELWSRVVELSMEQHADSFSIELAGKRSRTANVRAASELQSLLSVHRDEHGLRPLAGLRPSIAEFGPEVLGINLYASGGWVAGISDWGSKSALFEPDPWAQLQATLRAFVPPPPYDVAEAEERPHIRQRGGPP
jgi:hypothetical protein